MKTIHECWKGKQTHNKMQTASCKCKQSNATAASTSTASKCCQATIEVVNDQDDNWASIALVTQWLKSFWSATTQMSSTKTSMLSTTHAIFCGLQEDIWLSITSHPANTPAQLKNSLVSAHHKLSDYYTWLDESPLYIWWSCEYIIHFTHFYSLISIDLPIPI